MRFKTAPCEFPPGPRYRGATVWRRVPPCPLLRDTIPREDLGSDKETPLPEVSSLAPAPPRGYDNKTQVRAVGGLEEVDKGWGLGREAGMLTKTTGGGSWTWVSRICPIL